VPRGVAHACLAEPVVFAVGGSDKTYPVRRNIEWEKVKEIYCSACEHGMKPAAISGVDSVFTDKDIARVRELALRERASREVTSVTPATACLRPTAPRTS
jgi:hypothetical protein